MGNHDVRLADLSPQQKRALLARLMSEKARPADPLDRPVHQMFEAQARKTPDSIAVGMGGEVLTYSELNARANRLAHVLKGLGVGPEVLVGLSLERGPEMLVGLLGILKAGGAYLPLDPAFPASRLAYMLDDARVPVLVTTSDIEARLSAHEARPVRLDTDADLLAQQPETNPEPTAKAANLAYVIYTSGSTGKPKGVMIGHRALTNFLVTMAERPGFSASDVLLAVTTLSFDIAALELLLPLTVGARIEVASKETALDGVILARTIETAGVTVLQATPASWRLLLDSGWAGSPSLKALCGGEALTRDLADRLLASCGSVWNMYGPTETTVWSTVAQVEPGDGPLTIGRPVANTRVYTLDARLQPVPVGVAGELFIGGSGLARGYLDRPELTAERFVSDPFSSDPGARMYRTGDLARFRPDGTLECLGRVDNQVKIRGFRIELGEVEAALSAHPGISAAAAAARDDSSGEKRLLGYYVPRSTALTDQSIREWLRERLPDYMVPSILTPLTELPLTPNGKVDRKALPDPEPARPIGPLPPSAGGPVQDALAEVWAQLLGRTAVGVDENFFEIGGHSLLAAQMLTRVRETFGAEVALKDFFENSTISGLSRLVESALRAGIGVSIPPLTRANRSGPIPASFAQQRLWFLDQLDPGSPVYNVPAAVHLRGTLDVDALRRSFDEIVRRHEVLRTRFASERGAPIQVIDPAAPVDLPIIDLSSVPDHVRRAEALRLAAEEAVRPFDLAAGPLFRLRLFRLAPEDHVITVVTHHSVSDGWSIGVLIAESGQLYAAFANGEDSPLADPEFQYADYSEWQSGWLQGETLETHLAFWREALAGVATLELPADRPRPLTMSGRGGTRAQDWPRELVDSLKALGRTEGATLFMTILAGLEAVLSRHSGQADFAVGTPVAGRPTSKTERLIGFFANTLALRADLSGDPSFKELIRRARAVSLAAYARQDVPFDLVVNELTPNRESTREPLFRVMIVLQNAPLPALSAPELEMEPLEIETGTAKFDLTLNVTETETGIRAVMEYSSDLYDAQTAERLLGHLRTLLESAVAEPDTPFSALTMLTVEERRMLLQWNEAGAGDGFEPPTDDEAASLLEDLDGLSDEELDALIDRI